MIHHLFISIVVQNGKCVECVECRQSIFKMDEWSSDDIWITWPAVSCLNSFVKAYYYLLYELQEISWYIYQWLSALAWSYVFLALNHWDRCMIKWTQYHLSVNIYIYQNQWKLNFKLALFRLCMMTIYVFFIWNNFIVLRETVLRQCWYCGMYWFWNRLLKCYTTAHA